MFDGQRIRRVYDEESETWWFSVGDIIQVLTQQPDYQTARKYWNKLKERLNKEGHKAMKGLKDHNLWEHMTEAELIFSALAELSTRQIAESASAHWHEGKRGRGEEGRRHCKTGAQGAGKQNRAEGGEWKQLLVACQAKAAITEEARRLSASL